MAVVYVNEDNFQSEVLESNKKVLIDFFATWCGPCQMLAPVIDEIADEVSDVVVCKIDVDQCPELAKQYGVMSIPTLIVMENGQVRSTTLGAKPKQQILELIKE